MIAANVKTSSSISLPLCWPREGGETEQPRSCSAYACNTVLPVQGWKDIMAWPAGTADRMNPSLLQEHPGINWDGDLAEKPRKWIRWIPGDPLMLV